MHRKKASLNLSVNAIVVLILAITMLGLGLGFMKNTFGGVTEQFEQVSGDLEKQLVKELENKGLPAAFSVYSIDMDKSETKDLFFSVKASVTALTPCDIKYDFKCQSMGHNTAAGECDGVLYTIPEMSGFQFTDALGSGDVEVLPIELQTSGVLPDTYILTVEVKDCHTLPVYAELVVEVS